MPPTPSYQVLARIALLVASGDFITKEVAARWLGGIDHGVASLLRFGVVHNDAAAFGLWMGPYTFQWNLALTLAAIALIVPVGRELAHIDRHAPVALGLIAGGALGNFASLVLSPEGVVDFIALRMPAGVLVLNVADVAAYAGLVMLLRTTHLIVKRMRHGGRMRRRPTIALAPAIAPFADMEVVRAIARDDAIAPFVASDAGEFALHLVPEADARIVEPAAFARRRAVPLDGYAADDFQRPMSHPTAVE
ncbi:MAG TPA: signal peptidase II [Gemmatimonadaceae bacterium]|nr:signal peptidase II [Gemmatimonadaceae bacterium]